MNAKDDKNTKNIFILFKVYLRTQLINLLNGIIRKNNINIKESMKVHSPFKTVILSPISINELTGKNKNTVETNISIKDKTK